MPGVTVLLGLPTVDEMPAVLAAQRSWQRGDAPLQLHPGDLGWNWRFGAEAVAAVTRTWTRDGAVVAVGLLDAPTLLRLAFDPALLGDPELAQAVARDLDEVLPLDAEGYVEACAGSAVRDELTAAGWVLHEPWTQLRRDLTGSVTTSLRVVVVGPDEVADRVAVQRSAFEGSTFTAERWESMASGPAYGEARCLLGLDAHGAAVAAATVWSAGAGRAGLLEPVGVHRDHQGKGYGREISLAAAAALRELGASHAQVCTPSANAAAVATYVAAGFAVLGETRDLERGPLAA